MLNDYARKTLDLTEHYLALTAASDPSPNMQIYLRLMTLFKGAKKFIIGDHSVVVVR